MTNSHELLVTDTGISPSLLGPLPVHPKSRQGRRALVRSAARIRATTRITICGQITCVKGTRVEYRCDLPSCPRCSVSGWHAQRSETERLVTAALANPNISAYLITVATPHHGGESLTEVLGRLEGVWSRTIGGKHWCEDAKRDFGWIAYRRYLEVTRTRVNGWHPHHHVLVFLDRRVLDGFQAMVDKIRARAVAYLEELGFGLLDPDRVVHSQMITESAERIAAYLAKGSDDFVVDANVGLLEEADRWRSEGLLDEFDDALSGVHVVTGSKRIATILDGYPGNVGLDA